MFESGKQIFPPQIIQVLLEVCTSERKAGRVEMIEAQIDVFLGTDRQGQFLKQQVAAIDLLYLSL